MSTTIAGRYVLVILLFIISLSIEILIIPNYMYQYVDMNDGI